MCFTLENSESVVGASPRAVIQPSPTPWILWAEGRKQIQNLISAAPASPNELIRILCRVGWLEAMNKAAIVPECLFRDGLLSETFHILKANQRVQKLWVIFSKFFFDIIYVAGFCFLLNIT